MVLRGTIRAIKEYFTIHSDERKAHREIGLNAIIETFKPKTMDDIIEILYFYPTDEESREIVIDLDNVYDWAKNKDLIGSSMQWVEFGTNAEGFQDGVYTRVYDYEHFIEEISTKQVTEFLNHYLSK